MLRDWLDPVSRSKIQLDFSIEKLAHLWVRMWSFRLSFPTILGTSTPGICAVVAVVVPRSKPHGWWGVGPGSGRVAPGLLARFTVRIEASAGYRGEDR